MCLPRSIFASSAFSALRSSALARQPFGGSSRLCETLSVLLPLQILTSQLSTINLENLSPVFSVDYALNFAQPLSIQAIAHSRGRGYPQFLSCVIPTTYEANQPTSTDDI
jgi:hypothetical protein